jgi:hypothetical protein
MADINRLAVFIAEVGYNDAERLMGIDADLLQKAVAGETLSNYEEALIDNGYSGFTLVNHEENYVDMDYINQVSDKLDLAVGFINDSELADSFRESLSFGQVDLDSLVENYGLFANLSIRQMEDLFDWLSDDDNRNAKDFLDLEFSWNLDDSEFWEWFREVFYGDAE